MHLFAITDYVSIYNEEEHSCQNEFRICFQSRQRGKVGHVVCWMEQAGWLLCGVADNSDRFLCLGGCWGEWKLGSSQHKDWDYINGHTSANRHTGRLMKIRQKNGQGALPSLLTLSEAMNDCMSPQFFQLYYYFRWNAHDLIMPDLSLACCQRQEQKVIWHTISSLLCNIPLSFQCLLDI